MQSFRQKIRSLYYTSRWHRIRKAVKDRAGWRCEYCGKAGRLEVHHVEKAVKMPDRFFDLSNLKCVCRNCHIGLTRDERRGPAIEGVRKWQKFRDELLA